MTFDFLYTVLYALQGIKLWYEMSVGSTSHYFCHTNKIEKATKKKGNKNQAKPTMNKTEY